VITSYYRFDVENVRSNARDTYAMRTRFPQWRFDHDCTDSSDPARNSCSFLHSRQHSSRQRKERKIYL